MAGFALWQLYPQGKSTLSQVLDPRVCMEAAIIVPRVCVTIDGVCVGNLIY
jgi:hypothetical protein